MILLPILFVIGSVCSATSDENVLESAFDALSTASKFTDDALMDLKLFGPQAELLMKTFSNIASIATENSEPKSKEYKALEVFKNRTDKIWKDLKTRSEASERLYQFKWPKKSNYFKTLSVHTKKQMAIDYIDPEMNRTDGLIDFFKQSCIFRSLAPQQIITYMHSQLVDHCEEPFSVTEAKEFEEHRTHFLKILLRLQVPNEPIPDPGDYTAGNW